MIDHVHRNGYSTHSVTTSGHSVQSIQSVQSAPNIHHRPEVSDASKLQHQCREDIARLREEIEKYKEEHKFNEHTVLKQQASKHRSIKSLHSLSFKVVKTFEGHSGKIYDADWSSDSTLLLSGSQDGYLMVWDRQSAQKKCTYQLPSASTWIQACSFSPNTSYIACGGLDNTLSIYQYGNGTDDYKSNAPNGSGPSGHKTRSQTHVDVFQTNRARRSSKHLGQRQKSVSGYKSARNIKGHSRKRSVSSIDQNGNLIIKDRPFQSLHHHQGYLSSVQFLEEERVITASGDQTCILWDVIKKVPESVYLDHSGDVTSVAINRGNANGTDTGGNTFISGSVDATVKLWDIRMSKCVGEFAGSDEDADVNAVCWFPDQYAFASGGDDGVLRMFDIRAYKQLNEFYKDDIETAVTSCCFSKSGRLLLAGYDDEPFGKAWDVAFAEPEGEMCHKESVSALKVAPDGGAILTSSWDKKLRLWMATKMEQDEGKRKARESTEYH